MPPPAAAPPAPARAGLKTRRQLLLTGSNRQPTCHITQQELTCGKSGRQLSLLRSGVGRARQGCARSRRRSAATGGRGAGPPWVPLSVAQPCIWRLLQLASVATFRALPQTPGLQASPQAGQQARFSLFAASLANCFTELLRRRGRPDMDQEQPPAATEAEVRAAAPPACAACPCPAADGGRADQRRGAAAAPRPPRPRPLLPCHRSRNLRQAEKMAGRCAAAPQACRCRRCYTRTGGAPPPFNRAPLPAPLAPCCLPQAPSPPDSAAPETKKGGGKPGQHLLKHAVTPEAQAAAAEHLGTDQLEAGLKIRSLRCGPVDPRSLRRPAGAGRVWAAAGAVRGGRGSAAALLCATHGWPAPPWLLCRQPELRAMFTRVFGFPTASGNNGGWRGRAWRWPGGALAQHECGPGLGRTSPAPCVPTLH